ncbi:unnamed protein product [Protopolystoma xenopodis]|uniref:Uncharacterized protein n=1 Tax=Protopolystoma xenopodis TaxID=117903 RepID=A0A3S5ADX7_9PLAT|nr:unnamed protein product [Protopolystoma xenopodis]
MVAPREGPQCVYDQSTASPRATPNPALYVPLVSTGVFPIVHTHTHTHTHTFYWPLYSNACSTHDPFLSFNTKKHRHASTRDAHFAQFPGLSSDVVAPSFNQTTQFTN